MKKIITTLLLGCTSLLANAQTQIYNGDFEEWAINDKGVMSPVGWYTSNECFPEDLLFKGGDNFQGRDNCNRFVRMVESEDNKYLSYSMLYYGWFLWPDGLYHYQNEVVGAFGYSGKLNDNPQSVSCDLAMGRVCFGRGSCFVDRTLTIKLFAKGEQVASAVIEALGTDFVTLKPYTASFEYIKRESKVDSIALFHTGYHFLSLDNLVLSYAPLGMDENENKEFGAPQVRDRTLYSKEALDKLTMTTLSGTLVAEGDHVQQLDLNHLPNGYYLVKYELGGHIRCIKVALL